MQRHFWHNIRRFWPILMLTFVELVIMATNYKPGTYLMGWDNVMPEFNFRQALVTNVFGVWQEHRGVGLPDGMGHAANLVHTVFLWILSLALPQHMLRYTFHFLMHLMGMAGMYYLLSYVMPDLDPASKKNNGFRAKPGMTIIGALFYGLNLVTIQMFYTPLEAFSVHYAALPWLAYSLIRYLQQPSRTTLLLFVIVSILSTPQYFIPTLLLPTVVLLGTISITCVWQRVTQDGEPHSPGSPRRWRWGWRAAGPASKILIAICSYLCVNAFWLLPYVYNLPYNAPIIQNAKINEMSSGEVYERNRAFGDLYHVLTSQGFMLDFEDVDTTGAPIYVMQSWRTHLWQPTLVILTALFSVLVIAGIIRILLSFLHQESHAFNPMELSILVLWSISFILLANNTPALSDGMQYLRTHIPLFAESYRFPFTKFSLLYGFASSMLLVWGLKLIAGTVSLQSRPGLKRGGVVAIAGAIIFQALPIFQGHFFYDALRVSLPKDYIALFNFMNKQDHKGRTAYLPASSYWSWKHYNFGYVGSGFLWYGLSQALMDRAFDPWSNGNENYFWELSRALYAKDSKGISNVFQKYDIRYIILDGNLWAPSHDRSLYIDETRELLAALPDVKRIGQSNNIQVYERTPRATAFVQIAVSLPTVFPAYTWTDNDVAYRDLGDYQSSTNYKPSTMNYYPFRSLFTKRASNEREFTIDENSNEITIRPNTLQDSNIRVAIDKKSVAFSTDDSQLLNPQALKPCGVLKQGTVATQTLQTTDSETLRMSATNQRGCLNFATGALTHRDGYLVAVESRHVKGGPLMMSIINDTAKHVELETLLEKTENTKEKTDGWQIDYFVLPPLASDGLGYTVYFTNDGIGDTETINDVADVTFYPLPYEKLIYTGHTLRDNTKDNTPQKQLDAIVTHPNPSLYHVTIPSLYPNQTLVLSQAYNANWKAYDVTGLSGITQLFPYVFGSELTDHVYINNWENGWRLQPRTNLNQRDIVIIFWPQVLEYVGLVILIVLLIIVISTREASDQSS